MGRFSKSEAIGIGIILGIIFLISALNMRVSLRRARDAQRKDDLAMVAATLEAYKKSASIYPAAADGKIVACIGPETQKQIIDGREEIVNLAACRWGEDPLGNLTRLPVDPQNSWGSRYVYFSNGRRFQVYASLEGKDEDEFNPKIEKLGIKCGVRLCNFGRASSQTPLEKTIEEGENELGTRD